MHGMTTYFIRRLLLIPLTFICITFMVYTVLRVVPGGPIEQAVEQIKRAQMQESGAGASATLTGDLQIPQEAMDELKKYYRLDKPIPVGYASWLFGIMTLDFGKSYIRGAPVVEVIVNRFPISIYFGLISYFATWLVCVPLGVSKAIKHKSMYDLGTSIIVFLGYSIPGFIACLVLMMLFATDALGMSIFPLGGFRSDNWEQLGFFAKVVDQLHHTIIPVIGFLIGGFAGMTILMKNSLLDNMGADYVRTAFAKGLSERRVIFIHALRNSLIPITASIGHALGLLFAGSFLIETTCNIPGMGLLGYQSVLQRDYPIIMATVVFGVIIRLTGNIISDVIWALIDPRIRFGT